MKLFVGETIPSSIVRPSTFAAAVPVDAAVENSSVVDVVEVVDEGATENPSQHINMDVIINVMPSIIEVLLLRNIVVCGLNESYGIGDASVVVAVVAIVDVVGVVDDDAV
mmetsp:Transcript_34658/g.83726  ORF Transcript_34658/g.83726 Transcript_34658/m.83726 type:complete len:110 (+) Transcript_34658:2407-2736(+)